MVKAAELGFIDWFPRRQSELFVQPYVISAHYLIQAYFGLKEVMVTLLKNGHDPTVKDTRHRMPLL